MPCEARRLRPLAQLDQEPVSLVQALKVLVAPQKCWLEACSQQSDSPAGETECFQAVRKFDSSRFACFPLSL